MAMGPTQVRHARPLRLGLTYCSLDSVPPGKGTRPSSVLQRRLLEPPRARPNPCAAGRTHDLTIQDSKVTASGGHFVENR